MTSSSSLYGSVITQSTNSGNSTSLYGEAGTPIPDTAGNLVVRGDLVVLSGNILTTAQTGNIFPANATTINLGLAATALNIGAGTGTTTINNNLTVDGANITIAQGTGFLYSEANNRLNRPNFQSTTGNSSGVRAIGPNTTTSSLATISAFSSSDLDNGSFINIQARNGVATNPLRIQTGEYIGGVLNASGTSLAFIDNATTYATVNPSGPTIGTDLTTKTYVDALVSGSGVTSLTGTANQVIVSSPTGAVTLSLPQSIATTSNVTFADITATDDLTVQGNNVNLAQATVIGYSENNDRLNRPEVKSTTGNSSGFRVSAPNATTSASAVVSTFNTNDPDNGKFLNINARGNVTTPLRIQTGEYVGGTLGASGDSIVFVDGSSATHATINPAGPTVGTDLTTKTYVDSLPAGGVTSITGTANQVIASSSTGAITLSLPQSIATTSNVTFADVIVGDDLTVQGNNVNLAPSTIIGYNENNDRALRPAVQSTTGNSSGFRVLAPNATTSAQSNLSVFGTNDIDNGEFLSFRVSGSTTAPFSIRTGKYTAGVLGASGEEINFIDNVTTYASINPAGPTVGTDLTTKTYVDSLPAGGVTSITGTADQVIASSSTGAITLSLPQSIATTSSPTFAGATLGNITVGVATDQTIATTSGDLILDSASGTLQLADAALSSTVAQTWTVVDNTASALSIGATGKADILKIVSTNAAEGVTMSGTLGVTGVATVGDDSRVLGQMYATRSTTWTAPPTTQTNLAGQNGFYAASSANGAGYAPVIQAIYYSGDTTAGTNSAAAFTGRGAGGTNTSPSACATNQVLGTVNFDGYGTTNFANSVATANAGAGTTALNPLQVQGYARQAFADSAAIATTVTGASGTGSVATLTFTTQNTAPYAVGQTVAIAGMTPSGYNNAAAVITAATTSSISYANATTGFTSGGTITAARTVTQAGMGFRVRGWASSTNMITSNRFNFMDLTASNANFKSNAYSFANEVITGSTLTAINYMTLGSASHTIGNIDGITNIVRAGTAAGQRPVQTVRYTQTATAAPATGDGPTYRLATAGSNGTVYNLAEIGSAYSSTGDTNFSFGLANGDQNTGTMAVVFPLTSSLSATTIRATLTPSATPGANTLSTVAVFDAAKISASVPIKFPTYTAAAANAITGAVGWQISISNSPTVGGRMAFWDTTNARWSYISDNSAV